MSLIIAVVVTMAVVAYVALSEFFKYIGAGEEEYADGEYVEDEED